MPYRHYDQTGETAITGVAWGLIKAGRVVDRAGTAQAGGASTITLDASAPTANDSFANCYVAITSGTGAGQIRARSSYNGATKVLTVSAPWDVNPNGTSVFRVFLARRHAVQNIGTETLVSVVGSLTSSGTSDGVSFPRWALDTVALSCPFNVAAVVGGASGSWPSAAEGAYYYRLTGVKDSGETTGSIQVSANVAALTDVVTLTWDALPGSPDNIRIYRSDVSGDFSGDCFLAEVAGGATTYDDDGSVTPDGSNALPSANTTGGSDAAPYGVPPTLSADDLDIGDLAPGQQAFYWEEPLVAAGTPTTGNPRTWVRRFEEAA